MMPRARPRRLKKLRGTRAEIQDILAMISGQLQGIIIALDSKCTDEVKEASVTDEIEILRLRVERLKSVAERHFADVPATKQGDLL